MKHLASSLLALGLVACAQAAPTPTAQPQVGAGAQSQDAPLQAGLATAPLTTLNREAFSFASLTWSSTFEDFQAVFGAPSSDEPVNPRVRYSCFDAKIGLDPVSVCVQLRCGLLCVCGRSGEIHRARAAERV